MSKSTTLTTLLAAAGFAIAALAPLANAQSGPGTGPRAGENHPQHAQGGPRSDADRAAMQEKMRNAKTPEERHQIAQQEMGKRMAARGDHAGHGPQQGQQRGHDGGHGKMHGKGKGMGAGQGHDQGGQHGQGMRHGRG